MRKLATTFLGALLVTCLTAASALALVYPPGPGGACPDSVNLPQLQNIAAACHPALSDTVMGAGGIITGMDTRASTYGYYIQYSNGGTPEPWTGIQVYTGNENQSITRGFVPGDSVVVSWGQYTEYNNGAEIQPSGGRLTVRKVSSGNPLPAFKVGTTSYFERSPSNPNAEQWEGCLVRVPGPLRIARAGTLYGNQFIVVDNVLCPIGTVGICDSLFIETTTLANPVIGPQALDAVIQSVQGVWEQYTDAVGYQIKVRFASDIEQAIAPALADGYAVADDTIRVTFDRQVTQASAEDLTHYSLLSGDVMSATMEAGGMAANLGIYTTLTYGQTQTVNVSGVVSAASGLAMTLASRSFYHGVTPISTVQAADPAFLSGSCVDRSMFAGTGSTSGMKLTFRGVCTGSYPTASNFHLQDASAATRNGILTYGPLTQLIKGHQYLFVGSVQEYYGETEGVYNAYLRDEGVATMPAAVNQTVAVLRDSTCDATNSFTRGEEYEGVLIKLTNVKIVSRDNASPGDGFDVAGPYPTFTDTIHITNRSAAMYTFTPDSLARVDVTGVLSWIFGQFVVLPRNDADISFNLIGVEPSTVPTKVAFAAYPNPARVTNVSFTLPKSADVDLSVFDLSGRKVTTLASGTLPAASYNRKWDGGGAGAGVYFIRLRVGSETYNLRTVSLK
jgi:hypothetical protein